MKSKLRKIGKFLHQLCRVCPIGAAFVISFALGTGSSLLPAGNPQMAAGWVFVGMSWLLGCVWVYRMIRKTLSVWQNGALLWGMGTFLRLGYILRAPYYYFQHDAEHGDAEEDPHADRDGHDEQVVAERRLLRDRRHLFREDLQVRLRDRDDDPNDERDERDQPNFSGLRNGDPDLLADHEQRHVRSLRKEPHPHDQQDDSNQKEYEIPRIERRKCERKRNDDERDGKDRSE